ncbi:MAG TPA: hypothetical protein VEP66_02765 [Myxococcales bacterium]|nr:hypothetical protein [Myxococcales bacterium]
MIRRHWYRWFLVTAALVAAAALRPVTVLEIENAARGQKTTMALREGEPFSVTSQHSMYDRPVTEEFVVEPDLDIALTSVSSPSAAVREYLGLSGPGERQEMEREMKEIVFRVAAGTPQRLLLRGSDRSFLELGDHGDRLVMRANREPAALHWIDWFRACLHRSSPDARRLRS